MSDICPKCNKAVYAAEKKIAASRTWHSMCLKCGLCNKMLDSSNIAEHENQVFCKQCHGKKYGPKGYGYGGGAGVLSMDTASHLENNDRVTEQKSAPLSTGTKTYITENKPVSSVASGKPANIEDGCCPRCGKRVYGAEKAIGCPTGVSFHRDCFSCQDCKKKLDSMNICTRKDEKDVYCKGCYGRKYGPKGFGFGQGAGCLNMG